MKIVNRMLLAGIIILGGLMLWAQKKHKVPAMIVTSTAFEDKQHITPQYTCEGKNSSPQLKWEKFPAGTRSFALIVDDPDAPGKKPWVHWLVFNIPAYQTELPEKVNIKDESLGIEGKNSWGKSEYGGPCPPSGKHHYRFSVFALDIEELKLDESATKEDLLNAMKGHIRAQGMLVGTYERRGP